MLPNMNPKQLAQMMKQFGIKSEEIACEKVVLHKSDGSQLVITEPQVVAMEMQGQKSFQIQGKLSEAGEGSSGDAPSSRSGLSSDDSSGSSDSSASPSSFEEDVKLVMQQASVSRETAEKALKETRGDLAAAILLAKRD